MTVIVYSYSNADPAPKKSFQSTTLHFMITYVVHSKVCNGQVTYRVPTYIMLIHVLFKQTTTA